MKLSEAMKLLEEGKKVRHNTWKSGDYLYYWAGYVYHNRYTDGNWTVNCDGYWEEYVETVKASTLKVGDKFCHQSCPECQYIVLPPEMMKYVGSRTIKNSHPVQDLTLSRIALCHTPFTSDVVKL